LGSDLLEQGAVQVIGSIDAGKIVPIETKSLNLTVFKDHLGMKRIFFGGQVVLIASKKMASLICIELIKVLIGRRGAKLFVGFFGTNPVKDVGADDQTGSDGKTEHKMIQVLVAGLKSLDDPVEVPDVIVIDLQGDLQENKGNGDRDRSMFLCHFLTGVVQMTGGNGG